MSAYSIFRAQVRKMSIFVAVKIIKLHARINIMELRVSIAALSGPFILPYCID